MLSLSVFVATIAFIKTVYAEAALRFTKLKLLHLCFYISAAFLDVPVIDTSRQEQIEVSLIFSPVEISVNE